MNNLGDLSDEQLLARLRAHVGRGHVWQAQLVAYLAEVEQRRLDLENACPSMWEFCIRILGMSESEANLRIAAARIVRRFPSALGYLERGELHLCALYTLRDHLTSENHADLLCQASGKTTAAVRELLGARFPRPDVPERIAPMTPQASLGVTSPSTGASTVAASAIAPDAPRATLPRSRVEPLSSTRYRVELTVSAETKAKLERCQDLMRHRNVRGDLEIIVDAALDLLLAKLEKERLGRTNRPKRAAKSAPTVPAPPTAHEPAPPTAHEPAPPTAHEPAPPTAHESAPPTAHEPAPPTAHEPAPPTAHEPAPPTAHELMGSVTTAPSLPSKSSPAGTSSDRSEIAAATMTETPAHGSSCADDEPHLGSESVAARRAAKACARRSIPKEVRREVFARDGEQCTYVDAAGNRCPARGHLELDHIDSWARGGSDVAFNLRVRCRPHNLHHAEQVFGRAYVEARIQSRRRKAAAASAAPAFATAAAAFASAARGLRNLGFREQEVRRAIETLETKLDSTTPAETVLREALALLT